MALSHGAKIALSLVLALTGGIIVYYVWSLMQACSTAGGTWDWTTFSCNTIKPPPPPPPNNLKVTVWNPANKAGVLPGGTFSVKATGGTSNGSVKVSIAAPGGASWTLKTPSKFDSAGGFTQSVLMLAHAKVGTAKVSVTDLTANVSASGTIKVI